MHVGPEIHFGKILFYQIRRELNSVTLHKTASNSVHSAFVSRRPKQIQALFLFLKRKKFLICSKPIFFIQKP